MLMKKRLKIPLWSRGPPGWRLKRNIENIPSIKRHFVGRNKTIIPILMGCGKEVSYGRFSE